MKKRLDLALVDQGLAKDQDTAGRLIMSGVVLSDNRVLDKPGYQIDTSLNLRLKPMSQYVSRGGDKLASVAGELGVDFVGQTVLDVGASTGGFSDYALQHGAVKVYAVDVGRGQLSQRLQQDQRVVMMEQTDIRDLKKLSKAVDLALVDVSFVALKQVLGSIVGHLTVSGLIVALMKPQFEATKAVANQFKGIISDEDERQAIIKQFEVEVKADFEILSWADSKVAGAKGNLERFYLLKPRR